MSQCTGCGAPLQHEHPDRPGYLPPGVKSGGALCRRCYRLIHYGAHEGRPPSRDQALEQVAKAIAGADVVTVIAEIADFDGGLPGAGLIPADKPAILAINKIDLLPPKARPAEVVTWAEARWRRTVVAPALRAALAVSAVEGTGMAALLDEMRRGNSRRAVVIGATSVGKSTVIRRLLADGEAAPTVSRLPGTTQAVTAWRLRRKGLVILDTPGLVPGDRLIDILCPACAAKLLPRQAMSSKLFSLRPGQAVVFGGFAAFILDGGEPRTFLCYAGDEIRLHRTTEAKALAHLEEKPAWLLPWACAACRNRAPARRIEAVPLEPHEDLAVAGLGWISLRGGAAVIKAVLPEGVRLIRRPAMFGMRRAPADP